MISPAIVAIMHVAIKIFMMDSVLACLARNVCKICTVSGNWEMLWVGGLTTLPSLVFIWITNSSGGPLNSNPIFGKCNEHLLGMWTWVIPVRYTVKSSRGVSAFSQFAMALYD